jgi:hypothetical protein
VVELLEEEAEVLEDIELHIFEIRWRRSAEITNFIRNSYTMYIGAGGAGIQVLLKVIVVQILLFQVQVLQQ